MKALVLSGGGSKGSYEIGVWKALKKLHIKFAIVTGTSAGALNGALITQNSYLKAVSTWKKLNLKVLFGQDAVESGNIVDIYKMYGKNFLKYGGMNAEEIENLIRKAINPTRFYHSKTNFGLVTYNLTSKKAVEIEKKDIDKDHLVDYLMASSTCFPAFQKKDIEGLKYIDGGYYDNLPINLAIKMGASEIIAVDLRAPGVKKIPKQQIKITTIKPNNKLTNFLNFYEEGTIRNIKLGYNDTLKVFNKYEGKLYTFKKGHLAKNVSAYQETYEYIIKDILNSKPLVKAIKDILNITSTKEMDSKEELFLRIMEHTGISLNLDETKIYSYKKFNKSLKKQLALYSKKQNSTSKKVTLEVEFLNLIKDKNYKDLRKKALLNPLELLRAVYLYTICEA